MSLNCEPSELTPLRRSNQFQRQQQQQQHQQQEHQLHVDHHSEQGASVSDHSQSDDFIEYMSINNNNHPVGSESSRGDTSEPNSQQAFNPKSFMMSDTRRVITRVTIDFVILLCGESFNFMLITFDCGETPLHSTFRAHLCHGSMQLYTHFIPQIRFYSRLFDTIAAPISIVMV